MIRHSDWIGTDWLAAIDLDRNSGDKCKVPDVRIPTQRARVADACARGVRGGIRAPPRGWPAHANHRQFTLIGKQGFSSWIRFSVDRVGNRMKRDVE